jgi:hypothetical protein
MYDYFNKILWPLKEVPAIGVNITDKQYTSAINELFIDFKLNLYADLPTKKITKVSITQFSNATGDLIIKLRIVYVLFSGTTVSIESDALNLGGSDEYTTYHFNQEDFSTSFPLQNTLLHLEGFICVANVLKFNTLYPSRSTTNARCDFYSTTTSVFTAHAVSGIVCNNKFPLLCQKPDNLNRNTLPVVTGNVKLVEGTNCIISVQPSTNTIIVSAQVGANTDGEGQSPCGKWTDPISTDLTNCPVLDTLCNDVIYSVSGVVPDKNGNVQITASSPLTVTTMTRPTLPEAFRDIFNNTDLDLSASETFTYIGLPQNQNNPSVFDCDAI